MSFIQLMNIEIEARRLITRARRISRKASRGHICIPCRLHIHHRRIPAILALTAGIAFNLLIAIHAGLI